VNVVGGMSTWHASADALLSMDIEALAATVGWSVCTASVVSDLGAGMARACRAAKARRPAGQSRIATLIVPHDLTWSTTPAGDTSAVPHPEPLMPVCNEAAVPWGHAALYLGGDALLREGKICTVLSDGIAHFTDAQFSVHSGALPLNGRGRSAECREDCGSSGRGAAVRECVCQD
jgi:hypothetical protein